MLTDRVYRVYRAKFSLISFKFRDLQTYDYVYTDYYIVISGKEMTLLADFMTFSCFVFLYHIHCNQDHAWDFNRLLGVPISQVISSQTFSF